MGRGQYPMYSRRSGALRSSDLGLHVPCTDPVTANEPPAVPEEAGKSQRLRNFLPTYSKRILKTELFL